MKTETVSKIEKICTSYLILLAMVPRSFIPVLPFKITCHDCHAFREDVHLVEVVGVHIVRRETGKQLTASNSKSENPILLWPKTENRERNRTETTNRNIHRNRKTEICWYKNRKSDLLF